MSHLLNAAVVVVAAALFVGVMTLEACGPKRAPPCQDSVRVIDASYLPMECPLGTVMGVQVVQPQYAVAGKTQTWGAVVTCRCAVPAPSSEVR